MVRSRFNKKLIIYLIAAGIFSFLTSLFLLQLFFGINFLLWLFEKNSEKKKAFDKTGLLLLIFAAARLLSVFLSPYPGDSYQSLYKDLLFYASFFSLGFYFKTFEKEDIGKIFIFLVISFSAVALIGLIRFNLRLVSRAESFGSGYSTYSSYLLAGTGILLSLYSYFNKKFLNIVLYSVLLSILYSGIITSLGRFNYLIAMVILITAIILFRINYKAVLFTIIFTAIISFISISNNSVEAEQRISAPTQLSDRDIIYQGALVLWDERPLFGFGPRTFNTIFPFPEKFADKNIGSWHNDFLQVFMESGILGLSAFIVLLVFILYKGIKFIIQNKSGNSYILYGILLAITGIILSSLTAGFINSPVLSVQFSLLTALLSAVVFRNDFFIKGNKNGNKS